MEQLLMAVVQGLVEDKGAVQITVSEPDAEGVITYHLTVAPDDMGRVIGRQGRTAKAIRTIMRSAASRGGQKVSVDID